MLSRHLHNNITWIDLESPTREEIRSVVDEFKIEPLVAEELLLPSMKPRAEFHGPYAYFVMHFPALRHTHKTVEQEIDFVIGKDFIITTRYEMIDPLHKFSKVFEANSILDKSHLGDHAGFVFYYMLKRMYKAVDHEVDFVHRDLTIIEQNIFSGHEIRMVTSISRTARDLLNLRQTLEPHRDVLRTLEIEGGEFFGKEFISYLRALSNDYYRVHNHIMRSTESLHELRETNNSLLSTKEGETMRTLTIMALLIFPLDLLVTILETDSPHNPIKGLPYDFWIIVATVCTVGTVMVIYFRHKKWL